MSGRVKYGDRAICSRCGHEVEWHGKRERVELAPERVEWSREHGRMVEHDAISLVMGGWEDRGASAWCPGWRDGMALRGRLHKVDR